MAKPTALVGSERGEERIPILRSFTMSKSKVFGIGEHTCKNGCKAHVFYEYASSIFGVVLEKDGTPYCAKWSRTGESLFSCTGEYGLVPPVVLEYREVSSDGSVSVWLRVPPSLSLQEVCAKSFHATAVARIVAEVGDNYDHHVVRVVTR